MNCPDCGEEIIEVTVERTQSRSFKVDHEKKELTPILPASIIGWEDSGDFVYRCYECDSLNINELLSKYELKEE
jgi:hypothetical protein